MSTENSNEIPEQVASRLIGLLDRTLIENGAQVFWNERSSASIQTILFKTYEVLHTAVTLEIRAARGHAPMPAQAPLEAPVVAQVAPLPRAYAEPARVKRPYYPPCPRPSKETLLAEIEAAHWNLTQAARNRGLSKTTLDKWMKHYGIERPANMSRTGPKIVRPPTNTSGNLGG